MKSIETRRARRARDQGRPVRTEARAARAKSWPSCRPRSRSSRRRRRRSAGRSRPPSSLLFCAALAWAWWGTIDIVASATGKIVPSGRTKVIQPFETGVVRAIQRAGRAGGQGRRRADRARSDRECRGPRSSAQRSSGRAAQRRAAARGAGGRRRSAGRLPAARRCGAEAGRHPAGAPAQPGERASRPRSRRLAASRRRRKPSGPRLRPPSTSSRR